MPDPDRREFNRGLSGFQHQLGPGDVALFHFSGHGVEIDGQNFLLSSDVPKPESGDKEYLKEEAIGLDTVLSRLDETGASTRILIIDACRDNPFAASGTRGLGSERGLARMEATKGTFIMYSAGYGQTALDRLSDADSEPTSVYTRVLVKELNEPGKDIAEVAKSVRTDVAALAKSVGHDQFPAYYDELDGAFYMRAGEGTEGDKPIVISPALDNSQSAMSHFSGADIFGHDLPGMPLKNGSEPQCEEACVADRRCKAFTFNASHSVCFLKSDGERVFRNPNAFAGYRVDLESRLRRLTITIAERTDYPGNDYREIRDIGFGECSDSCENDDNCLAFTYIAKRKGCWLKNAISEPIESRYPISGKKD